MMKTIDGGVRDVRKILVGPHADVGAPLDSHLAQRGKDVQVHFSLDNQVVGVEIAARFGELGDPRCKSRRRPALTDALGPGQQQEQQDGSEQETMRPWPGLKTHKGHEG